MNNNTIKILIFASTSTVIGALLYGGGFYLVKEKVQKAALVVLDLKQAKDARNNIESVNQNIVKTQTDRESIEEFFVDSDSVIPFIERIEELGSSVGIKATLKNLKEQNNNELVFSLNTEGSFQDTLQFTALVESLPFSLVLSKAYFSRVSSGEDDIDNLWDGNFTAVLRSFIVDAK